MAEDEHQIPRRVSPLKALRKVPGSFDDEGISPTKEDFDVPSLPPTTATHTATELKDALSLQPKPTDAHLLPLPESSFVENLSYDDSNHVGADSMTQEQQVRAHLLDVESSFAMPISPISAPGAEGGVDDTYLFDGAAKATPKVAAAPAAQATPPSAGTPSGHAAELLQHTRAPAPDAAADSEDSTHLPPAGSMSEPDAAGNVSQTTSALESMSSSPTAAATARTISRAVSAASQQVSGNLADSVNHNISTESAAEPSSDASLLHEPADSSLTAAGTSTGLLTMDADPNKLSVDAGNTPGQALKAGKRPKYLRSRNASQRSSTSSFLTNDDGDSDVTASLGTDYALHSGGPIPPFGTQRSLSNMLSRSISMGSMVSGIDEFPEMARLDPLEPLEEDEKLLTNGHNDPEHDSDNIMATPKAKRGPLLPPTDTVIARHVRNVEVPESLAKEYKSKGGLSTPTSSHLPFSSRKTSDYTPGPGTATRGGKNLTLKEQSSTIERLSKENFDLKLKVMFLSDRLDKLSEEGVKEMISENVELKTSLAVIQRDNKILRRRVKELEKRLRDRDEEERPSTARSGYSSDGQGTQVPDNDAQDREEELIYLRERVEEYTNELERLRNESLASQAEKRRLAEAFKAMGDRNSDRIGDNLGRQEEADVWKDLLEQETARREQADEDNRKLREEVYKLKQEMNGGAVPNGTGPSGMHHTTNIYNITRKAQRPQSPTRSRPMSGLSGEAAGDTTGSVSQSSTLVEELRKESDLLRHENAELRREVGAQTSMLTSRNREKERLYQEIEDLKLAQRRGGTAASTIDSLLERSASRAGGHERSNSRASGRTRMTATVEEDPDREELENKLAEHRDKINELKLQNQELQRELETCMQDFETAVAAKAQAEDAAVVLQEDMDNAMGDLMALQAERDEALQDHSTLETEFENLRKEAQEEIDALENDVDQRSDEIQRLQSDLAEREENFGSLQEEMRKLSEVVIRLEDDMDNKGRRIEQLEQDLGDANKELEELEAKLLESNDKASRLGVQQESSQNEIAFLREEQEGDKIRIGDLEAALAGAETSLREERERAKELESRLATERTQREIVANKEKEEVQQFVNELNREAGGAKDEARRLRKALVSREVEATEWKERLLELENNLREALGDLNGTRSSLLKSIAKLQRELENAVRELDITKGSIMEKDRIIQQRDALLESHGLESRKLAEMLDKERQAHRTTKNAFETFQRTHQHVSRTVTSQDSRIIELETSRAADKKRITQLETTFKEQLVERNNLLLILWTRLSALCGTDWAHDNSLINGRALPSLEAVSTMLPGFAKNLLAAVKTIETIVGNFQSRIKSVERDLWKEYQSLETNLDMRTKKLERLETIVRSGVAAGTFDTQSKYTQLENAYRALKIENATLHRANDARSRSTGFFDQAKAGTDGSRESFDAEGSPSPSIPTGPIRKDKDGSGSKIPRSKTGYLEASSDKYSSKSRTTTMTRTSTMAGDQIERLGTSSGPPVDSLGINDALASPGSSAGGHGDQKWMFRLRELEYKLKQEREARNMDRAVARQRIQEGEKQKDELVAELVRVKRRGPDKTGREMASDTGE